MWLPVLLAFAVPSPVDEHFERRIRPVLIESCYECHNSSTRREAGLALDSREGVRRGGRSGPAVIPGRPDRSLLVRAIRHSGGVPRMPKDGAKLSQSVVDDFVRWIADGAKDPRDAPPDRRAIERVTSWEAKLEARKKWWSFQPLVAREPPPGGSAERIDRFVDAKLVAAKLQPSGPADRRTLLRRVTYALTGLPPTVDETHAFLRDASPVAYVRLVDRLLASPRFGERWARHWMDWLRYAESHGSEGDPSIAHAWRYRDYLIRALNSDVPYGRLVQEHIAGDLLPQPRINGELAIDESRLGLGHYRMVYHGYLPTDALDEQVRFTENQIDVLSKAFLGLTVSCARCHDHKFDPISQKDFFAMYGVMASSRPALVTIDAPAVRRRNRARLVAIKDRLRSVLARDWLRAAPGVFDDAIAPPSLDSRSALWAWFQCRDADARGIAEKWREHRRAFEKATRWRSASYDRRWRLGRDAASWFTEGTGLAGGASRAGELVVALVGDRIVADLLPAGVFSHGLSSKDSGLLTSPRLRLPKGKVYVRVAGEDGARVRYAVHGYPRVGGIHRSASLQGGKWRWIGWDTSYWAGEWAYLELATASDIPVETRSRKRSWFGLRDVVVASGDAPRPVDAGAPLVAFAARAPSSRRELRALYVRTLRECIEAWRDATIDDLQTEFLGSFVRLGLLPNTMTVAPEAGRLVREYRRLEGEVAVPKRAPGVVEGEPFDQPLFARGEHRKPGAPVPRRFLEVFGAQPYRTAGSGRRELAEDFVSPRNPLVARVVVNRAWHHLFGRGIVATPDNLGRLGARPTHPELLDELAGEFLRDGGSLKRLIRRIVLSETYRRSSDATADVVEKDPENLWLARFPVRRLEAEAIRDAMLSVSGQLDAAMFGKSVAGTRRRRSVYVAVRRNKLDPLLAAFDAPEPHTTIGRRNDTNVPAQSLAMMNAPFVIGRAKAWARRVVATETTPRARIRRMFREAFAREATSVESTECLELVASLETRGVRARARIAEVERQSAATDRRLQALRKPVLAKLRQQPGESVAIPQPIASWSFTRDLKDACGRLHGTAHDGARVRDGALVVDGRGYVTTPPLGRDLTAKTLAAWVQLADLRQRSGGVMTVETLQGRVFDGIVYGERIPRRWLAGSDHFARTTDFAGSDEADADRRFVHVAITYGADGEIVAYRDGRPYGRPYRKTELHRFAGGESHVVFGVRHLPSQSGRLLRGRIRKAVLFDRALSAMEVAALHQGHSVVTETALRRAMPAEARQRYLTLVAKQAVLAAERARLRESADYLADSGRPWELLAQSLFNMKEFVYVR